MATCHILNAGAQWGLHIHLFLESTLMSLRMGQGAFNLLSFKTGPSDHILTIA